MARVAFNWRFGQVIIEKGVILQLGKFDLGGIEIQDSLENLKRFLFVEQAHREEVADMKNEVARFLENCCVRFTEMPVKDDSPLVSRKVRTYLGDGSSRVAQQVSEGARERVRSLSTVVENCEIN